MARLADTSLSGARAGRELVTLPETRGKPAMSARHNESKFTSNAIPTFADDRKTDWH